MRNIHDSLRNVKNVNVFMYSGINIPSKMYIIRHFPTIDIFDVFSLSQMYTFGPQNNKVLYIVSKIAKRS